MLKFIYRDEHEDGKTALVLRDEGFTALGRDPAQRLGRIFAELVSHMCLSHPWEALAEAACYIEHYCGLPEHPKADRRLADDLLDAALAYWHYAATVSGRIAPDDEDRWVPEESDEDDPGPDAAGADRPDT